MRTMLPAAVIALIVSQIALAEVTSVADSGFVSEHELTLNGSPDRVFAALTDEVFAWWDASHSYSGVAANFSLDARAGGCFCEALPDGGSVEHMRVVFAQPGRQLRMQGGLGPLQAMAVHGSMVFSLEAIESDRTLLRYSYSVTGYLPGGLAGLAQPVDQVQLGQLQRLAAYLQDG